MKTKFIIFILFSGLLCGLSATIHAQITLISMEEAIEITLSNNPAIKRDQYLIDQKETLAEAGLKQDMAQIFISSEEFDFAGQSGIHSINAFQNFNLPKANRIQKDYYEKAAQLANHKLSLTKLELVREVKLAYKHLKYAKEELKLHTENIEHHNHFLRIANEKFNAGESGKLVVLTAKAHLGKANLKQKLANENYQSALAIFNLWLQSEQQYDVMEQFDSKAIILENLNIEDNPNLQFIQSQIVLASAKIKTEEAALLPQINSGFKLQTVSNDFPFYAYQLGVNVPIFKKAHKKRIEASKISVLIYEEELNVKKQEIKRNVSELQIRMDNQYSRIDYIHKELIPIVNERNTANQLAFKLGEISYLEYLDGLEQLYEINQELLLALHMYDKLGVELEYWATR